MCGRRSLPPDEIGPTLEELWQEALQNFRYKSWNRLEMQFDVSRRSLECVGQAPANRSPQHRVIQPGDAVWYIAFHMMHCLPEAWRVPRKEETSTCRSPTTVAKVHIAFETDRLEIRRGATGARCDFDVEVSGKFVTVSARYSHY